MNFESLSKAWFAEDASAKAASRVEFRSATGPIIAPGITLCEASTVIHGDGKIEFRRRGDFGEREDFRPGAWVSRCDMHQVESLWRLLAMLGPDSFPARVADPGDTIRYLTAYVDTQIQTLAIGPSDPTQPAPGDAFMQALHPILRLREAGECLWAVDSALAGLVRSEGGAEADIRFRNTGTQAIGLIFDGDSGASDFHLRFAQKRDEIPYPKWHQCENPPAEEDMARLISLEPGMSYTHKIFFPCNFPDSGKYIGKIAYRQARFLDSLAGVSVLTGISYTGMAEFTV